MNQEQKIQQDFLTAYDEYNDAIFRFVITKTRNRDLALDIVQDTFTKTWEYLQSGKTIDNIRAFLYKVARNLIIDNSRKKTATSLENILEQGIDFGEDKTDRWVDTLDGKQAVLALEKLDEKYRDVLIMRFVESMEISDIADILDESENNISVRIHRALKQARELLEQ
ncbi:MAG: sigma-70 family RNA polymerase sigma factor [Candidatus Nomurabacteria bacterium]|nr:sigma-70 family RNA polymerase sigma factor [Candidatus Nomurabacteria bacterium]